jgi:hypothetical protein
VFTYPNPILSYLHLLHLQEQALHEHGSGQAFKLVPFDVSTRILLRLDFDGTRSFFVIAFDLLSTINRPSIDILVRL